MRLLWINHPGGEMRLEGDGENLILGRQTGRGITVDDGTVSREHARIFLRDGAYQVADLNSSNGTFVNGKRVTRATLRPGDLLKLGSVELRFEPEQADAEPESLEFEMPGADRTSSPAATTGARTISLSALRRPEKTSGVKTGLLRQDMAQQPFLKQALLVLLALLFAAALFVWTQRMTEEIVPDGGFGQSGDVLDEE